MPLSTLSIRDILETSTWNLMERNGSVSKKWNKKLNTGKKAGI